MAVLDATGFSIRTFNEIREEIRQRAATQDFFGEQVDVTPDSVLGILINLFSSGVLSQEELAQAVYDQFNRDKAEGRNLDDLAALVGVRRIPARGSSGLVEFVGNEQLVVPRGFIIRDDTNRQVALTSETTLNRNSCYSTTFTFPNVATGTVFSISVGNAAFEYTALINEEDEDVAESFVNLINNRIGGNYIADRTSPDTLRVRSVEFRNTVTTTNSDTVTLDTIGTLSTCQALVVGNQEFLPNVLTTPLESLDGLISVTNPQLFISGRLTEQDEQLRLRLANRGATAGTATIPSMQASLLNLQGVTSAIITENVEESVDNDGRPPKSFEAVVFGGQEAQIAEELWRIKPAGIRTFGSINRTVRDSQDNEQTVMFSRPTTLFIYVDVEYTLYSEETFPLDGVATMEQTVLDYGNNLTQGEDIIPQRIAAAVFNNVSGLETVTVRVGSSEIANSAPSLTTDVISVRNTDFPSFSPERITSTLDI